MQVRAEALQAALDRSRQRAVWVHGDDPLLRQEAADTARRAFRAAGAAERTVFDVDRGFRIEALAAEADSMSLFAESRLIELRFAGKPGKELGEALAGIVERLAEGIALLVGSPRLDRGLLGSAWFSRIERHALVVAVYPVEPAQLAQWIAQRLARQRQRADAATLAFLAERVEGNSLAAHQEISKLGLLFPEGDLPGEQVRAAVMNVARYDAFDAADAMLAGDAARTLRSLHGLRAEGEAESLVLWALAEALRTLLRAAEATRAGVPVAQTLRASRVYPPRDRLYERALGRLDTAAIRAALQHAARVDRMIKGLARGRAWDALEALALGVAGAPVLVAGD